MGKSFNDYDYTRDAIIKQVALSELHSKDGSAVDAGCACIETKHTYMIEGLSEEMAGFAKTEKEKQFYLWLGETMRKIRKQIDQEDWTISHNPGRHVDCKAKQERCVRQLKGTPGINPYAICKSVIACHK